MARISEELFGDLEKKYVDFMPNYDESMEEADRPAGEDPAPAPQRDRGHRRRRGDEHPPHNLREVIDGTIALIRDPTSPSTG